jgi:hypothetical protein
MSRITNALLGNQAYAVGATQPMIDITYGGQFGYAPDLTQWVSNQAYIRKQLICILLEAPRFFTLMPNPAVWTQTLKSLVELLPISIEGLNATLEVDFADHFVGGAGEIQQEIANVTRTRSDPTFTFIEKYGLPVQEFISQWILFGMMDPETKTAMVSTLAGANTHNSSSIPGDLLADWSTMSCLFFEPDVTHTKINKAWVTTNMMPKTTGEIIGKRDQNTASETLTLSINFSALSQYNLGARIFAQTIFNSINQTNANPYLRPSFIQGLSADVAAGTTLPVAPAVTPTSTQGYAAGVATLASVAVNGGATP